MIRKKCFSVSQKFAFFEKSPISKKSNLISKFSKKIEKFQISIFELFESNGNFLSFPKRVYIWKSKINFRSVGTFRENSHILRMWNLGLLWYSFASMSTGVHGEGRKPLKNIFCDFESILAGFLHIELKTDFRFGVSVKKII